MLTETGDKCESTDMSNKGPNPPSTRPNTRTANDPNNSNGFDRNKFRQTMPTNSRFNPMSPADRSNGKRRPAAQNNSISPTQSHVSTATNYAQPWSSPKIRSRTPPKQNTPTEGEPRFRRTYSMANRKGEQQQQDEQKKGDRPRINFKDFRKSIANKFKKGDSKKAPNHDTARMSAPIIKLSETSASQPQLPTTSAAAKTTSSPKKPGIRPTCSLKMQLEDRRKMYQKMGREQAMKVSNVQRMQRERQRDFGRSFLEPTHSASGSTQSIESMVVYSSPSNRSASLSMTDDDVEPVFKNSLTNKNVTSAQMASMKNNTQSQKLSSGPSFTSTPRLSGTVAESPTISNVRSISESSFCLMTSNEATPAATKPGLNANPMNETMYYSTMGLTSTGRETPSGALPAQNAPMRPLTDVSIASTSTTPIQTPSDFTVKQEVIEPHESASSSHCPSMTSTSPPSSDLESQQLALQQPIFAHPEQLNDLWMVSKAIRDKQLTLEGNLPMLNRLRTRLEEIDREKANLLETKKDAPNHDDMRRMWNLDREHLKLGKEFALVNMNIQNANHWLPLLEARRNELLSDSPPSVPASFV